MSKKSNRVGRRWVKFSSAASAAAAVLAVGHLASSGAQAADYYWDNNGTTAGFGTAGGTWTAPTVSQWNLDSTGVAAPEANVITATTDTVNFGFTTTGLGAGTITVSGTVDSGAMTFAAGSGAIVLSGGTINNAAVQTITVNNTSNTISSILAGAGTSLTKAGSGALILSGANTYTGATAINAGTLSLGNGAALGGNNPGVNGTSEIIMATGTTLRPTIVGPVTVSAPITIAGSVTIGAPTVANALQTFNEFILNGAIGGSGNVTFVNTVNTNQIFTVTLGAASNYSGTTTINNTAGTAGQMFVKLGATNALPTTTVLSILGNAGSGSGRGIGLNLFGFSQTLAGLTNTAATSRVQQVVNSDASTAATLTINGSSNTTYSGNLGASGAGFSVNVAAIPGSTNGNNFGLTKNGTGTFTLSGVNTFTGTTLISGGILSLGNASALSGSPLDTLNSIAGDTTNGLRTTVTTLTLGGLTGNKNFADVFTTTTGGYSGVTALTLNPGTAVTNSYSGVIANGAAGMTLTKSGVGIQVLSGANTYTGKTSILNGTLSVASLNSVTGGSASSNLGAPTTAAAGTLDFGALTSTGTLLYTGAGETTDRVINLAGGSAGATLDQSGTGLLRFTNSTNTTTGIGRKTLTLQGSTGGTGQFDGTIADNATTGSTLLAATFATAATTITLTSVDGITVGAPISGTGIAASTTVTAINTATKVVTLSSATTGAGTAGQTTTVTGVVNPTSVAKTGTGTWTLSGTSSYTGGTTITAGTLLANNTAGSATGTGAVVINNLATLGGTGSLSGPVTISSGGTISPGTSVESLATGAETWNGGGTYIFEISNGAGTAGVGYDTLGITGVLNIPADSGTPFTIRIVSLAGHSGVLADQAYTIASTGGFTSFAASDFVLNTDAFDNTANVQFSIGVSGDDLILSTTAVPEPGSLGLIGVTAVGLLARRRRHRGAPPCDR